MPAFHSISPNKSWILSGFILLIICTFSSSYHPAATFVKVWLTTADQENLLSPQTPLAFKTDHDSRLKTIDVNPSIRFQTMDGFGAAITGSSAYLLNKKLTSAQRDSLLTDLFTKSGINMNFIRHTIGSSDFSVDQYGNPSSYTYDDIEFGKDYPLDHFSISKDADIITLIKEIFTKNRNIKVLGTPWTAPSWMKYGSQTLNGWYLDYTDKNIYSSYANYFVKYIESYRAARIPIYAITIQNEPEFTTSSYPSMSMNANEQALFIREYLGPAFKKNNISTKIIAYDHNWNEGVHYAAIVLRDRASAYTDGTAYHCYEGSPTAMTEVHDHFPDKNIYFTECSGGNWSANFGDNFIWYLSNLVIGAPRNWSKTVLFWNLALNSEGGPTNGGCTDCRGVLTVNSKSGVITKNVEYFAIGHASKFIQPEAVRIGSTNHKGRIETVAFKNPDGSIALIAANTSPHSISFKVRCHSKSFTYTLPSKGAATFIWT